MSKSNIYGRYIETYVVALMNVSSHNKGGTHCSTVRKPVEEIICKKFSAGKIFHFNVFQALFLFNNLLCYKIASRSNLKIEIKSRSGRRCSQWHLQCIAILSSPALADQIFCYLPIQDSRLQYLIL